MLPALVDGVPSISPAAGGDELTAAVLAGAAEVDRPGRTADKRDDRGDFEQAYTSYWGQEMWGYIGHSKGTGKVRVMLAAYQDPFPVDPSTEPMAMYGHQRRNEIARVEAWLSEDSARRDGAFAPESIQEVARANEV